MGIKLITHSEYIDLTKYFINQYLNNEKGSKVIYSVKRDEYNRIIEIHYDNELIKIDYFDEYNEIFIDEYYIAEKLMMKRSKWGYTGESSQFIKRNSYTEQINDSVITTLLTM